MAKAFVFIVPAVLLFILGACEGLICYHCQSRNASSYGKDDFPACNEANLQASFSQPCPSADDLCIFRVVKNSFSGTTDVWRTCSKGSSNPCDPSHLPPGIKHIKCTHCNTDKCNLREGAAENQNNTVTFNINANVNLYIRQ